MCEKIGFLIIGDGARKDDLLEIAKKENEKINVYLNVFSVDFVKKHALLMQLWRLEYLNIILKKEEKIY